MAVTSYLTDVAGGMVAGALFDSDESATQAVAALRDAGVRMQDVSVVASDPRREKQIAGERAWTRGRGREGLMARAMSLLPRRLPKDIRRRYGRELRAGNVLVMAAADGQPADTLAALLKQAGGTAVGQWWQSPCDLFAPPELAGPF